MNGSKSILNELELLPQEIDGSYKFSGQLVMTRGFSYEFGMESQLVAINAIIKILTERVTSEGGADYLQVLKYKGIRFWVIDDIRVVTVLMPSEY
jgi:hypothetical protein